MASRSDQLHSHQFTLQRAVGALAMRDPDPVSSPMRRIGGALFASVMIAVLAVAAVGVYGVLRPGTGKAWRDGHAMIIEKETGARYVYRDNVLYPVLNYTSALLILGSPESVTVSRSELVGVRRGTPMGIPGAPDPLPGPEQLVRDPWTLCSRPPAAPAGGSSRGVESVLRVGSVPGEKLAGGAGVLAVDPVGGLHLLWNSRRFALIQPDLVLTAFLWDKATATPVSAALLNAMPAGPDLGRVAAPRSDKASALTGFTVGEVFVVADPSGNRLYGIALESGVAVVTAVQAGILVADNANSTGRIRELSQAAYAAATKDTSLVTTGDNAPPADIPTQSRPGAQGGVCATFTSGNPVPGVVVAASLPPAPGEVRAQRTAADLSQPVDFVAVPPGQGVVVESLASAGSVAGSLAVISDLGLRFAVPSVDVLGMLGYKDVAPQRFPASLVALVPSGRALDPDAAALPATSGV
jgi:ESX secretion system ATPase EccB